MRPWIKWTVLAVAVFAIAVTIALEIGLHRAEPIMRHKVIETLSTRFKSRVELAAFHVSVLNGLNVEGQGLRLYPNNLPADQPLIAVNRFGFHTTWMGLFEKVTHVSRIEIDKLDVRLPPKDQRSNVPKLNGGKGRISILVDEIDCSNTSLVFGNDKPGKVPLDFEIGSLRLRRVGPNRPMHFTATLVNPKPLGDIQSEGDFGPWVSGDPGSNPVSGHYRFTNADLSTIKGIGGILSSTGDYKGTLDNIVVDGETDTPDFSLSTANQPVPLHTRFHAIVDGTNGDTQLDPVDAMLAGSHIVARGKVVRAADRKGKHIMLHVTVDKANIADFLRLAVKTRPPLMTGATQLETSLDIPPGPTPVPQKLGLKGHFRIRDAHFQNPKIQARVDQLSLRAQGKPGEAKQRAGKENVGSNMSGDFTLGDARLGIRNLKYDVPGAVVNMEGIYTLDGNQFDFHGRVRLKATVSQMVGGWKGIMLKPVDPFFKKNGAGTDVPIQITGTRSEPHFGLDFGHKGKDKEKDNQDQPPPAKPR